MRKAIGDSLGADIPLTLHVLQNLIDSGFRFVQVKGITTDRHYEYIEPEFLILIPIRELPADESRKDVYEPTDSELLRSWAMEKDPAVRVFVKRLVDRRF
ncbi:MAG TPA: hypothetical protein VHE34_06550 [Puia sp.]|uniref:hypothetical protein n=1 Tax=Puia sp. TaxID=2045100 RepID=UPI002B771C42|nr:hypothetical protein [Puia sp.]HVU94865.1 hypothetical protein [Puia sp.]